MNYWKIVFGKLDPDSYLVTRGRNKRDGSLTLSWWFFRGREEGNSTLSLLYKVEKIPRDLIK